MKRAMREFPLTIDEMRALIKKEESKKYMWLAVATTVVAALVGLIIWISKRREKDLEEHYEYFDDDFDELDENYEDFDESIYDDEEDEDDEQIEYVKINDFLADEENKEEKEEATEEALEEAEETIEK